jgi:hypothetical protein
MTHNIGVSQGTVIDIVTGRLKAGMLGPEQTSIARQRLS